MALRLLATESLSEIVEPSDYYLNPQVDEELPVPPNGKQLVARLSQKNKSPEIFITIDSAADQRQIFKWHIIHHGSSFRVCFADVDNNISNPQPVELISQLFN